MSKLIAGVPTHIGIEKFSRLLDRLLAEMFMDLDIKMYLYVNIYYNKELFFINWNKDFQARSVIRHQDYCVILSALNVFNGREAGFVMHMVELDRCFWVRGMRYIAQSIYSAVQKMTLHQMPPICADSRVAKVGKIVKRTIFRYMSVPAREDVF